MISTTYATQGLGATLKGVLFFVPRSHLKEWAIRGYLGYQSQGWVGILKSVASILGWYSVWNH